MTPTRRGNPRNFHTNRAPFDNGFYNNYQSGLRPRIPGQWNNRIKYIPNFQQRYARNQPSRVPPLVHNSNGTNHYSNYEPYNNSFWEDPDLQYDDNYQSDDFHPSYVSRCKNRLERERPCENNLKFPEENITSLDKTLCNTIDTIKRKLREKCLSDTSQEDDNDSLAVPSDGATNKITTEKKRIEHSKMSPKSHSAKRDDKKDETRHKSKIGTPHCKTDSVKKSQNLRRNILKQLFKMNNNNLRQILSNPETSVKYNFALASLIKETRNTLSNELRNVAEKTLKYHNISADTVQGEKIVQDAFLGHLETMLDKDASIELNSMEPQLIQELSKVLQEDLMGTVNDDISVRNLADVMHVDLTEEEFEAHDNEMIQCKKESEENDVIEFYSSDFESGYNCDDIETNFDPTQSINLNSTIKQENIYDSLTNDYDSLLQIGIESDLPNDDNIETNDFICTYDSTHDKSNGNVSEKTKNCTNSSIHKIKSNPSGKSKKKKKKKLKLKSFCNNDNNGISIMDNIEFIKTELDPNINFDIVVHENTSIPESNFTDEIRDDKSEDLHHQTSNTDTETNVIPESGCENCLKKQLNLCNRESQTNSISATNVSCQTDESDVLSFEELDTESNNEYNRQREVLHRLKKIDEDIQNLLQKKFKLYNLLNTNADSPQINEQNITTIKPDKPDNLEKSDKSDNDQSAFSVLENRIITHIATINIPQDENNVKNITSQKNTFLHKKYNLRHCSVLLNKLDIGRIRNRRKKPIKSKRPQSISSHSELERFEHSQSAVIQFKGYLQLTDHTDSIVAMESINNNFLLVSLDGNMYYYCGSLEMLLIRTIKCSPTTTCISHVKNSSRVYTGSLDSYLRCFDFENGKSLIEAVFIGAAIQSMCLAWNTLYIGTRSGYISQYDTINNALITSVPMKFSEQAVLAIYATKEGARKVLLIATRLQNITVNDAKTGLLLRSFCGTTETVYSLLYHTGNIFCGTASSKVQVFDFVTGELIGSHYAGQGAVCLKMYRGLLFAGCYDGRVYVFKPFVIEPLAAIPASGKMILSMTIFKNMVIVGYNDKTLLLWFIPDDVIKNYDL